MEWYLAVFDAIKSKLYSPVPPKKSRKPPKNRYHKGFSVKAAKLINTFTIFN